MKAVEEKQKRQLQALKAKEEQEKKKREEELIEIENTRKEELYLSMKRVKEEMRQKEEEDMEKLEVEWMSREKKAKAADQDRRNSFNQARHEMKRLAKIAKERSFLKQFTSGDEYKVAEDPEKSEDRKLDSATDLRPKDFQSPKTRKSFS